MDVHNARLKTTLLQFGLKESKCDPSLFIYSNQSYVEYLSAYVDENIITSNSLKQLCNLDNFLGKEVCPQSNWSLLMTQTKYIKDFLLKTNILEAKSIFSPMILRCKLSKQVQICCLIHPFIDLWWVGALQYLIII